MIWSLFGILLGILLGLTLNIPIPQEWTRYSAVIILGMADALFSAIRAETTQEPYSTVLFVTSLVFNIIFAIAITYLGEHLGLNLYLAVTVAFTFRILQNVNIALKSVIKNWLQKRIENKQTKELPHP